LRQIAPGFFLLEIAADFAELAADASTENLQGANDEDGDQRGDQCVFNCGRAAVVSDEQCECFGHLELP
jgi:hypothetical protein